ncbi:hypothetical protein BUALT_BualtUnG0021100 [Buddleja alternifolia]|uniref:NB-ARC domain-containing protein n=1 Tax=Buddleja alternifolia TaxID=168488 RepID=A0AAV6W111_9LAMI|nr:hypothetical protein BUALT_BualtUnG0021100 [Buddleja alternifolia]
MSDELETIGREMVKKCGCLPLAVSVIGGSLRHKQTLSEWEKVNENIDVYLKQQGEGVGKNKRVEQVLDLSYNALPYYLKPCFLYLGCFPEDQEIDAERLYLLWMAEGMISSEDKGNRETLRDVAERYLSELAFRCMVQVKVPEYPSAYRKFESCRLHDLMRDLCLSKAKEEKFLKVVDFEEATDHVSSPIGDIPRLAIYLDEGGNFADINFNEREKLRSLLTLLKVENLWSSMMLHRKTNFNRFKFLRILILDFCTFEDGRSLLSEVGKLVHLRYLSLHCCVNVGEELPRSIYSLPYLHTLNLAIWGDDSLLKLPNMIFKMKKLRHLFLGGWYKSMDGEKLRLDGLNELETLEGFNSKHACAADIPKLTNLRKLEATIKDKESLSVIVQHISNNESQLLRETTLRIDIGNSSLVEEGPSVLRKLFMSHSLVTLTVFGPIGGNLPCYEPGFCKNLTKLFLTRSEIEEDVMETLGKFPMLSYLDLFGSACMATDMICHANAFPQLKHLALDKLYKLEKWRVDEGAMPNLSLLLIRNCRKLEMMPDGLRHITTLQRLYTLDMPKEFNDRLRVVNGEEGQDYDKREKKDEGFTQGRGFWYYWYYS